MAKYQFQTEVNQLLKLIIHSMYSNKDIFLREIVSNASDALDKLNYLMVSEDAYKNLKTEPRIDISFNDVAKVLTVQDSGIGMNEEDLNNNLGTIARSGTKAFIEKISNDKNAGESNLIGQFGVGFYSAFMAAKEINVYTRKAASDKIYKWSSDGTNSYSIEEIKADSDEAKKFGFDKPETHGSAIEMVLNDDSKDYASRWKIEELIKRYSDHIAFPIYLHYTQNKYDDKGNVTGSENKVDQVNTASALWKRPKSELKPEDYNAFYKTISHDSQDPLHYVHTHAEGTQEYTTLFYVPQQAPFDMYQALIAKASTLEHEIALCLLNLTRQRDEVLAVLQKATVVHGKLAQHRACLVGIRARVAGDRVDGVEEEVRINLRLQELQLCCFQIELLHFDPFYKIADLLHHLVKTCA